MTFGEVAAALGLLTPLVLGVMAFYKDIKKKDKAEPTGKSESVVQGMTVPVDYAAELLASLKQQLKETEGDLKNTESERDAALRKNEILQAQLNTYRDLDRR